MDKNPHSDARRQLRELLREVRHEAGLLQEDIAERIGEPQSLVSKYESGERRLEVIELHEICSALGLSLGEFVRRLEQRLGGKRSGKK